MNAAELFRRLSVILESAGIPYMVTGSFAGSVYGMGRSTLDIDLIVAADEDQVRRLLDLLPENEFYSAPHSAIEACQRKSTFNLIDNITGLKIDFIFQKMRPFSVEEFGRRRAALVEGVSFYIVSPEDLIIATLEYAQMGASLRQIEDVTGILKVRGDELDFAHIEKWITGLGLDSQWNDARKAAGLP
jgi:hypothetical protein